VHVWGSDLPLFSYMKQVILGGKTPIEGHTTDILKRFMLTNEQRQLCIRVIGSIASLPVSSSGNQPRHMAGGSYESHRTCSHGCLRRGHPEAIMSEERSRNEGVHTPDGSWDEGMVRSECPRRLDH